MNTKVTLLKVTYRGTLQRFGMALFHFVQPRLMSDVPKTKIKREAPYYACLQALHCSFLTTGLSPFFTQSDFLVFSYKWHIQTQFL